jgi:acetylornithine deacetylase
VDVGPLAEHMIGLLSRSVQCMSVSGAEGPFVRFLAERADAMGFCVDLWEGDESAAKSLGVPVGRHRPLAGRPTLVITMRGTGGGHSLLFNAHSDVVTAGEGWTLPPWEGCIRDGRLYGRGACDCMGPLVSALWAMETLRRSGEPLAGDVLLEIVPGEEDCVGLGTLTSVARGHRADAAVVLEPTRNVPRCGSRPGFRFEIVATGRAVHGTFKWLGEDAIALMRSVLAALEEVERTWLARLSHGCEPIARPITVDSVHGEGWQGMLCDRCSAAGYFEPLPGEDPESAGQEFERRLRATLRGRGVNDGAVLLRFTERYLGHVLDEGHELCETALCAFRRASIPGAAPAWPGWGAFNSGCEAGVRSKVHGTPTLVWGPGDLSLAHAPDESIGLHELQLGASQFAELALEWCSARRAS